jgi:HD superfamily phosphodiesterase
MQEKIEKFKEIVIQNFSRVDFEYHEWMVDYHLKVVEKIAMELCDIYPDANRDIVQTLVWFHDFGKPFDDEKEREITLDKGSQALVECGFDQDFINKVIEFWKLMEKKNEIDLNEAPIETKIISSADGASHFVGIFYPSYFGDGDDFLTTQNKLKEKICVDWERKIVLPEVKKAFADRYEKQKELYGEFPKSFLN